MLPYHIFALLRLGAPLVGASCGSSEHLLKGHAVMRTHAKSSINLRFQVAWPSSCRQSPAAFSQQPGRPAAAPRRSLHVSASAGGSGNGNGSVGAELGGQKGGSSSRGNGDGAAPKKSSSEARRIKWAQTSFKVGSMWSNAAVQLQSIVACK